MKTMFVPAAGVAALAFFTGCQTPLPPGTERGPHGTIAYMVPVEASDPGVKIFANGREAGTAPLTLKIFGDRDGTFHDFGAYEFVVQAVPVRTNQHVQTKVFLTGKMFTPEDRIPDRIYFDMNQPAPIYAPAAPPPAYYYPPPYYYGPPYYYYGPRIWTGPHYHPHRLRRR